MRASPGPGQGLASDATVHVNSGNRFHLLPKHPNRTPPWPVCQTRRRLERVDQQLGRNSSSGCTPHCGLTFRRPELPTGCLRGKVRI